MIGPGLGQSERARPRWVGEVLAAGVPAVLDADALNLLRRRSPRRSPARPGRSCSRRIPGEAARLLGTTRRRDRGRPARRRARAGAPATRAVVVLKGARTLVCDGTLGDDYCSINPTGGPALATGGSGDVLAGVIGALLAQGLPAVDAARAGVYVHGAPAMRLARRHGDRGVMSSDLPDAIAEAIRSLGRSRVRLETQRSCPREPRRRKDVP